MAKSSDKVRIKADIEPIVKRALELRALLDQRDQQDIVSAALNQYLSEQIEEVIRRGMVRDDSTGGKEATKPPRKGKGV